VESLAVIRSLVLCSSVTLSFALLYGGCSGGGGGGPVVSSALRLRFSVQPATGEAGALLSPIEVGIYDDAGSLDTTATSRVTLVLSNAAGAQLQGAHGQDAVGGLARFSGLSLEKAGSGYTLRASASGASEALSSPFEILPAAPERLSFQTQPSSAAAGVAISPPVGVEVLDAFGNRVSGSVPVSLALSAGPLGGSLQGSPIQQAQQGLAVFPNLSLNRDSTYALRATSPGLVAAQSDSFVIQSHGGGGAPAIGVSASLLTVSEAGTQATFQVFLSSALAPRGDVSLTLTSSDPSEALVAPQSLVFSSASHLSPQTVTVTGVDDSLLDGNATITIVTGSSASSDPAFRGIDPPDVTVTVVDDEAAGITLTPTSGLFTTEAGGTASFSVVLNSTPLSDVQVGLVSSDSGEGIASVTTLTFTPANALAPQTVVVTGVDEDIDDGAQGFAVVTAPALSADPAYQGLDPDDVSLTNLDDDTRGVSVFPSSGLRTTESGGQASFAVVLSSTPTSDVRFDLTSTLPSEASVNPSFLVFTPANARVPQIVTVSGVDDGVVDGDTAFQILTSPAATADLTYSALNPVDVACVNQDDEFVGVGFSTLSLETTESGRRGTFEVSLGSTPSHQVTLALSSSDPSECLVAPASVTFTPGNARTPQRVTVFGLDDAELDGDQSLSIVTSPLSSLDPAYAALDPADLNVVNREFVLSTLAGGIGDGGAATSAQILPAGVALDAAGNLFVSEEARGRIRRVDRISGEITTYAGSGANRSSGDGGPALTAEIGYPRGLAFDASGNLFFADRQYGKVRKVDALTGIISHVAGAVFGFSGDGGPATAAGLSQPTWLAFDASGALYISDQFNGRIRRVSPAGIISTIAGSGATSGPYLDGIPALTARIAPGPLAFDSAGNLFVLEDTRGTLRRIDAATGTITRVAGIGSTVFHSGDGGPATSARLRRPFGLALDSSDNLLISTEGFLRRIDAGTGIITSIAGGGPQVPGNGSGGPASSAYFGPILGIALDSAGDIYLADPTSYGIRRIDAATSIITAFAGAPSSLGDGGPAAYATLEEPSSVVHRAGVTYIAEPDEGRVRRIDATGTIETLVDRLGIGDGALGPAGVLSRPEQIAYDAAGTLFIADLVHHRIRRVDAATGRITTYAGNGVAATAGDGGPATQGSIYGPTGVALDSAGNLYVSDSSFPGLVRRVDAATGLLSTYAGPGAFGGPLGDGGPAASAALDRPRGLACDASGNLYIADSGHHRIRRVDAATGIITTVAGDGFSRLGGDGGLATLASLYRPGDVALDGGGNLFIADTSNHRVRRVDVATGLIATVAGTSTGFSGDGGPATSAQLQVPTALALGSGGDLYVLSEAGRVRRVAGSTGIIETLIGPGGSLAPGVTLLLPTGLALYGGGLAISRSFSNDDVLRVDLATGASLTLAGGGHGDGGPVGAGRVLEPTGLALDSVGNLYVADVGHHVVRRIDALTGVITTVAGEYALGFGGDGGAATSARLSAPRAVAADGLNRLYIADWGNHRVRLVDLGSGSITTLAGTGGTAFGGDGGPASAAPVARPSALALDASGDLFVAEAGNGRVRKIDLATGLISTYAGNGQGAFTGDHVPALSSSLGLPSGLAFDGAGNLYIADASQQRVRRVDALTRYITTHAGNGGIGPSADVGIPTTLAQINPLDLAFDSSGRLLIVDSRNGRLRRIDP